MATLLQKANQIKTQKDTYLLPENLKAGITCLGVTGTYVPNVKIFSSKSAMMADVTEPDNEYGVVYYNKQEKIQNHSVCNTIIIKDTVTLDTAIESSSYMMVRDDSGGSYVDFNYSITPTSANVSLFIHGSR